MPSDHDAATAADHPDGVGEGVGRPPDALDHHLGPVLLAPGDGLVLGEHRDADALGGGALVRVARGDGDVGRAIAGDQRGAQPDRAGAEHQHLAVGLHVSEPDPSDGDGQRLGERRGDRVHAVGDRRQVLEGCVDQLGEAAVATQPDARAARPHRFVRPVRQNVHVPQVTLGDTA